MRADSRHPSAESTRIPSQDKVDAVNVAKAGSWRTFAVGEAVTVKGLEDIHGEVVAVHECPGICNVVTVNTAGGVIRPEAGRVVRRKV